MTVTFGKFDLCRTASYPICMLFSGVTPDCVVQDYLKEAGFPHKADLANFVASLLLALLAIYLMFRSYRKYAAVGRKEMYIMFGYLFLAAVAQIILTTGVAGNGKAGKVITAVQAGFTVATFWTLLVNGVVGFQLAEDGTLFSTLAVAGSGGVVAIITAIFSVDAGLQLTSLAPPPNASDPQSMPVWILYFIVPAACIGGYLILQTIMILRLLGTRRPLVTLFMAVVAIAVAQVFIIVTSTPICTASNSKINGSFAGTILTGVAVVFLYRYWDSITEGKTMLRAHVMHEVVLIIYTAILDEWDEYGNNV
ncbi:chitin synthase III catalytic subunit [Syncephalis pseudoplumigaleata]|uniref:Chitin synthase III catalytic subunit n=1 Tax=Syncephalis pseudoplumigaleata TaxID=1712513 RepID=A0A4P9YZ28_9FUNG|nr:chitin synthase III catalytic subunit [Syncephalis pseudoplumigaleata]|eukprot:RKP25248.1 chitin synthase III catalytic subunit [Syncephalis pseudoplumigaleata]